MWEWGESKSFVVATSSTQAMPSYHALNFALNFLCRSPDDEHLPGVSDDTRSISPTVEDIPTVSSSSSSVIDDPPHSRSSSPMSTSDEDTARATFRGRGREAEVQ